MDSSVAAVTETSEPSWLAERRAEAVEAAKGLSLPGPKTRGWEFNDLSGLDLSAYEPAEPGDIAVAEAASARLAVPEGSAGLTQVDGAVVSGAGVEVGGNGRPDAPVVMPLSEGVERFGDLVSERLGTIVETGTDAVLRYGSSELRLQNEGGRWVIVDFD